MNFSIPMLVKHLTGTPFSLHQSEEKFVRLFFISVSQFVSYLHTHTHTQTYIQTNKTLGRRRLTLSAPEYFCLIMPRAGQPLLLTQNLAQPYFVMLQQKWWKKIFKFAVIGIMALLIMSIFWKNYAKNGCFFLKLGGS